MKKILGKYHNLWTLPLAILLAIGETLLSNLLQISTFTPEKIAKIIPALVVFLFAESIIRIYYLIQYPDTFHYACINENRGWKYLTEKEKFHYAFWHRLVYLLVFAVILFAM